VRKKGGGGFFKKFGSSILGAAGSVFGGAVGGPFGARLGGSLGGGFGSLFFNKDPSGLIGSIPSLFSAVSRFAPAAPVWSPAPIARPGPGAPLLSPPPLSPSEARVIREELLRRRAARVLQSLMPTVIEEGSGGGMVFPPTRLQAKQMRNAYSNRASRGRSRRRQRDWVRRNWDVSP
jgi:hypothetical protein